MYSPYWLPGCCAPLSAAGWVSGLGIFWIPRYGQGAVWGRTSPQNGWAWRYPGHLSIKERHTENGSFNWLYIQPWVEGSFWFDCANWLFLSKFLWGPVCALAQCYSVLCSLPLKDLQMSHCRCPKEPLLSSATPAFSSRDILRYSFYSRQNIYIFSCCC